MADHVLTLPLTDEALERLKAAARAAGLTPEAYAVAVLDRALASGRDDASGDFEVREKDAAFIVDSPEPWPPTTPYDTTEAKRRLAEYDRTGKYVTLEDAMEHFERALEDKLSVLPSEDPTAAEALAEYDRTGVYETFEEWSTAFETDLKARLDARR